MIRTLPVEQHDATARRDSTTRQHDATARATNHWTTMDDLRITKDFVLLAKEIQISTARSGGPGGQNVNKVNSKVTLRWNPSHCFSMNPAWRLRFTKENHNRLNRLGEIVLHSERYRDQKKNLQDVRQRLVAMLIACKNPPKKRKATKPTVGSQKRRLKQKREHSEKKTMRNNRHMEE